MPIVVNGQIVGAVGVSGVPSQQDAQVAQAGVDCAEVEDAREDAMANDRGLLPKASREDLSEHLTRQLARWYQNAYQDDNLFLTMARRPELLDATWGFIRYIYGGSLEYRA